MENKKVKQCLAFKFYWKLVVLRIANQKECRVWNAPSSHNQAPCLLKKWMPSTINGRFNVQYSERAPSNAHLGARLLEESNS